MQLRKRRFTSRVSLLVSGVASPFLIALQFLTRFPVRCRDCDAPRDVGRSLLFYPLIGGIIGALLAAIAWASADLPDGIRATVILAAWVLVTGMLHLDGLGDSADGWLGGHGDRERTLEIMKDPRTGTAGVVMILLVLLLKYNALLAALAQHHVLALIFSPLLARAMVPLLLIATPYVRPGGLGETLSRHVSRFGALFMACASAALALAILGRSGLAMLIAAAVSFGLLRTLMMRRIGGTTGDTAGAMIEISEAAILIAAVLFF